MSIWRQTCSHRKVWVEATEIDLPATEPPKKLSAHLLAAHPADVQPKVAMEHLQANMQPSQCLGPGATQEATASRTRAQVPGAVLNDCSHEWAGLLKKKLQRGVPQISILG